VELVKFIAREKVKILRGHFPNAVFYDTVLNTPSAGDFDFVTPAQEFSTFTKYGGIPVSGLKETSDTVEGVWQGLKVIDGKIDRSYFKGKGRKRYGKPEGHMLGAKIIGYLEARKKIYVPTYEFMVFNCVPKEKIETIYALAKSGVKQFFFDVDDNGDIHNLKSPLSQASVLVNIINRQLKEF
jgi:hypothetical protein